MEVFSKPPPPPLGLPPSLGQRYAPVAPLPFQGTGHYLRRSVAGQSFNQSESSSTSNSNVESEGSESDSASSSADEGYDDTSGASDREDSDSVDTITSASVSSRSSSQSSLYDSELSDNDGFAIISSDSLNIRNSRKYQADAMIGAVSTSSTARGKALWQTDNLGVLALLVPITGVSTMVVTEIWACASHFDCSQHYPTLSYAAQFKPEGHAFTIGMCMTSIFILATVVLFHWFLRLKLFHPAVDQNTTLVTHSCLGFGTIAACSLFGLAVFDMGAYHDTHVFCTVVFFITAWVEMLFVQAARRRLMRDDDVAKLHRAAATLSACTQVGGLSGFWIALQRWKRMRILSAYRLGRVFLYAGLSATGLFALLFLCVNGFWPNPLGFTAVQEALLEALAILCQLFFMGTLSCELAMLTRVVEHRDYKELERAE